MNRASKVVSQRIADHLLSKDAMELGTITPSGINFSDDQPLQYKKVVLGQMKVPVYQKQHFWSPDFVKCDGKIIKYNMRAFGVWRVSGSISLVHFSILFFLSFSPTGACELVAHNSDGLADLVSYDVPLSRRNYHLFICGVHEF